MQSEQYCWRSERTGDPLQVVRYGSSGRPLVYIPTSGGDQTEFAAYGLPEIVGPWIERDRLQAFAIDGYGPRTLFNDALDPRQRIRSYASFERSLVEELLPRIGSIAGADRVGVVGVSYGAFVAANLLFKHPGKLSCFCGLGGVYRLAHRLDGFHDDEVYFHTPLDYLPGLEDPRALAAVRAVRPLALYGAAADEWLGSTRALDALLRRHGIPHRLEVWPAPAGHHERWWRPQLRRFLETLF